MDEKQDVKGRSKRVKKYYVIILILFLFLLGGIVVQYKSGTKNKLHRKIEEFRTAGYPVSLEELEQSYSIPDNVENAADYIMEAISNYKDSLIFNINDWSDLSPKGEALPDEVIQNAGVFLRDNQQNLELLHKAAALEYCRYPVDLSIGQKLKYIDISKIVRLICVESVIHAQNGDSASAVKSLICSFNIVDTLADIPLLLSQIVRMAYHEFNISTLEQVINTTDLTGGQLILLSKVIEEKQRLSGISYGLTGELCGAISEFENYTPYTKITLPKRFLVSVYRGLGLNKSDVIIYLDILNKIIEAGKLPLHERQEAAEKIQAEIHDVPRMHLVVKTSAPAYPQFLSRELTSISQLRAAQTAIAVQRYRLKQGKLPDSLSSLVPEFLESVPLDPFDGKQMRYKKLDSGFVVYSVDVDLIDDGGREEPKNRQKKVPHWDITFTIKK